MTQQHTLKPETLDHAPATRWDTPSTTPDAATLPLLDRVLAARGVTPDDRDHLLNPSMKALHPPERIPDLDKAAQRTLDAVKHNQHIVVYGDYDVDGITGTAILVHTLRAINPNANVTTYVPHRVDEGYGLNTQAIDTLADQGADLIISVDCGITAHDPANRAKERNVDLIITDHHNPPSTLEDMPGAYAVVHPRRPDSTYPFGELCGAGVAFKLAWRLATLHCNADNVTPTLRTTLLNMLGFVALGTIADVVPLVDENRVLTKFGLPMVRSTKIPGLRALLSASQLDGDNVNAEDVGFRLAPRLNAIGRLGHARDALELMIDAKGQRAADLASELTQLNESRRNTERRIVEQAKRMAREQGMTTPDTRAIVLAHEDWHPGVIGIACSRLVDAFARPVVLMQIDGDTCKGSGRSIERYNLHAALESCADHLTTFGGHDMAAGLKCPADNFDAFRDALTAHANTALTEDDLAKRIRIDTAATIDELTPKAVESLESLAPFGAGNPRVSLLIEHARLESHPEPFGRSGDHCSLHLRDHSGSTVIRTIAWRGAQKYAHLRPGDTLDVVLEPKCSRWRDRVRVEPVLVDLRVRG